MVQLLLAHGASVNTPNKNRDMRCFGDSDSISSQVQSRADVNSCDFPFINPGMRIPPATYGGPPESPLGIHLITRFRIGFHSHVQCFDAMCSSLGRTVFCRARSFL